MALPPPPPPPPTTTTFTGNSSGIVYGGGLPDGSALSTPFFYITEMVQACVGTNAEIQTVFTGTDCALRIYADGSLWVWSIDGGGVQSSSPTGSSMQWLTLTTGLSDSNHTVYISRLGTYVSYDTLFQVTGSSPALSAPTGYSDPQFGFTSGVTRDNSQYYTSTFEGYSGVQPRGSFRFKATTSQIRLWNRYGTNNPIGLVVDGDVTSLTRQNPRSGWGWTTFTGLDGAAQHEYRVIVPNDVYVYNVMAAGLNTTSLTAYPADYWQGDEITAASTITNGDAAPNWNIYYAIKAKRGWQIEGTASGTAKVQGVAQDAHPGVASPTPARVILGWGRNDVSSTTLTDWSTAINTIVTKIHSDLPTIPIYWLGLFDTSSIHSTRGSYNSALATAMNAFASSIIKYFPTDGTGTITTSDGTNPDASGAAVIGNYLFNNMPLGTITGSKNLFLKSVGGITGSTNLILASAGLLTGSTTGRVGGLGSINNSVNLSMGGGNSIVQSMTLWTGGSNLITGNANLFLNNSASALTSNLDLTVEGYDSIIQNGLNLTLNGSTANGIIGGIPLSIVPSSNFIQSNLNLEIVGYYLSPPNNSLNLIVSGSRFNINNSTNLFITTQGAQYPGWDSLDLWGTTLLTWTGGGSSRQMGSAIPLLLSGYPFARFGSNMNLVLKSPLANILKMIIKGPPLGTPFGTKNLYIHGSSPLTSSIPLILPKTTNLFVQPLNLYSHGY